MKLLISVLFIFLSSQISNAQKKNAFIKGYYLTKDSAKVSGYLRDKAKLQYKKRLDDKLTKIDRRDLLTYRIGKKDYYFVSLDESFFSRWYEKAVSGEVDLFISTIVVKSSTPPAMTYTCYVAKRSNEDQYTILGITRQMGYGKKYYHQTAKQYFKDDEELAKVIPSSYKLLSDIPRLVKSYNRRISAIRSVNEKISKIEE